jgi:hypothetical protein
MAGTLEQNEEEWIKYILGPSPSSHPHSQNEKTRGKDGNYVSVIMTSSIGKYNNPLQFFSLTRASVGNPGAACVGGIIFDSDGQNIMDYS